ncbi:hypothetical protein SNEBB_003313 [Seison nebaliae]|nr:hypothetical protein SNEBB_003313 [Seison nebaliae]
MRRPLKRRSTNREKDVLDSLIDDTYPTDSQRMKNDLKNDLKRRCIVLNNDVNRMNRQQKKLNDMWQTYHSQIKNDDIEVDLHGSLIEVEKSRNECLIGISGVVFCETKHTFILLTESGKRKTILKDGSQFLIRNGNKNIRIVGDLRKKFFSKK